LFPARESLVSDIPAGDGKIANLFFTLYTSHKASNIFLKTILSPAESCRSVSCLPNFTFLCTSCLHRPVHYAMCPLTFHKSTPFLQHSVLLILCISILFHYLYPFNLLLQLPVFDTLSFTTCPLTSCHSTVYITPCLKHPVVTNCKYLVSNVIKNVKPFLFLIGKKSCDIYL
jgi:hypothetical protein